MSDESSEPAGDERLSADTIHELLARRRRRQLLCCLYLCATPMRLPDVADLIVEWDRDERETDHDDQGTDRLEQRLRIYNALYHSHVPKLVEADVVEYNQAEDMVDLSGGARWLRPYLEQTTGVELEAEQAPRADADGPRAAYPEIDVG